MFQLFGIDISNFLFIAGGLGMVYYAVIHQILAKRIEYPSVEALAEQKNINTDSLLAETKRALSTAGKIEAIRFVRGKTCASLPSAKAYVDTIESNER